ncbi:MAG: aldehyde dehydrogenase family protein, partial [Arenicellales bacterium]|nr:aldehyde dehydrogenase family protein [Arenicellales bacterium]
VGEGNRKDIRNAVEAAHGASKWGSASAHHRAQVLYFLAENLEIRADEFSQRLEMITGTDGDLQVKESINRLFFYAGWCDKYEGTVHQPPLGRVVFAVPEPVGVMGLICPERDALLGLISLIAPAIALGNTVITIPSESGALVATDFYQILETSDIPAGVVNIITGARPNLASEIARHNDVDGLWCAGHRAMTAEIERLSVGNLKQTWALSGDRNWLDASVGQGTEFLRRATQVKNVWVPYGE